MTNPLVELWIALQTVGNIVTQALLSLFEGFGLFIPQWVINLVLIGLVLLFFFKWYKKLPWIILAFLALFFTAFVTSFISNLFFY